MSYPPRPDELPPDIAFAGGWGGSARFSGVLMLGAAPPERLAALLPAPLELIELGAGKPQPLLLAFGEMSRGGAHLAGIEIPGGARYREVGAMVPFVRHPACTGPVVFPYRMYADDVRPVFLGNACYGLRKELANVDWNGADFEVRRSAVRRFHARGTLLGEWQRLDPSDAAFRVLYDLFQMPILGRRDSGQYVQLAFGLRHDDVLACRFGGSVELLTDELEEPLRLSATELPAIAVRGLGWRTSPPRALPRDE